MKVQMSARDLQERAENLFHVRFPVAMDLLKTAYRQAVREIHPDKTKKESAGENLLFIEMVEVYDAICSRPKLIQEKRKLDEKTVTGIPLSELGLGLGPMVNATDCGYCERKGYTSYEQNSYDKCQQCRGKRGNYRCRICFGTGVNQYQKKMVVEHHLCRECNGKGEVAMFNPCLPKGLLAGFGKNR